MKNYLYLENDKKNTPLNIIVSKEDSNNIKGLKRYFLEKDNFHQIDKNLFFPDREISFSIFTNQDFTFKIVLEATPESPKKITPELLNIKDDIFIKASAIPLYNEYIDYLQNTSLTVENRMQLMREKSKIIIRNAITSPNAENILKTSSAVEEITDSIINNKDVISDLISKINNDYYLYVHSINVAVLSIGVGASIGLTRGEMSNLGFGAILHDIGKSTIHPRILYKPERLTALEFKVIKSHVFEGQKILKDYKFFPDDSMPAVTQHHEKLSGKGYPLGIKASNIKLFGKITAIADCFDSLTTPTPHKYPLSPFSALNILVKETENYDRELIEVFIKMLGNIKP